MPLSPFAQALLGQLAQLPPNDGDDQEPDQDADDGDVVQLPPQEKSFFDPGEPTQRAKGLLDSLIGAMPDLRRTPKPGVSMKTPSSGNPTPAVLSEALTGRSLPLTQDAPDVASDVATHLADATAKQRAQQESLAAPGRAQDIGAMLADSNPLDGDLTAPFRVRSTREDGPTDMVMLMGKGVNPGLMNGPKQVRGERELNGYGQIPVNYTVRWQSDVPARLNAKGNAKVAANPGLMVDEDNPTPEQISFFNRLVGSRSPDDFVGPPTEGRSQRGLTLDNSDLTGGLPMDKYLKQQQDAKREADAQAQWALEDKEQDRKFDALRKSQATSQNATQRNFLDTILGRTQPSGKTRQQELYDDTMSEFRNRQTLANRMAGMGNSAAMYAGTPRYNAKLPGGSKPVVDDEAATQAEFAANKERMAPAKAAMASGGKLTDAMLGRNQGVNNINYGQQARLSARTPNYTPTQRTNIASAKQRNEFSDSDALAARDAAMSGQEPAANASPRYMKVYSEYSQRLRNRVGPTVAAAMRNPTLFEALVAPQRGKDSSDNERNRLAHLPSATREVREGTMFEQAALRSATELQAKSDEAKKAGRKEVADKFQEEANQAKEQAARLNKSNSTLAAEFAPQTPAPVQPRRAPDRPVPPKPILSTPTQTAPQQPPDVAGTLQKEHADAKAAYDQFVAANGRRTGRGGVEYSDRATANKAAELRQKAQRAKAAADSYAGKVPAKSWWQEFTEGYDRSHQQ